MALEFWCTNDKQFRDYCYLWVYGDLLVTKVEYRCLVISQILKEKRQALAWKPSGLASCYSPMQTAKETAPGYDACCKCTIQMFQLFYRYVAVVSYGCCKGRTRCCIYFCNGCTCMLQASAPNVSSVLSDVCCKCVYLDVVSVLFACCVC